MTAEAIVIDIETGDAPAEALEPLMEGWTPPSNIKNPELIEQRRIEAMAKIQDKAALLDASPIISIAALPVDSPGIVFHSMDASTAPELPGWEVLPCGDEKGLLQAFGLWAGSMFDAGTTLVGHAITKFDLPKLRQAYLRYRLRLPELLHPGHERVEDTQRLFKLFSMEHRDNPYISLATVCGALGIASHKDLVEGAQVPALHRAGRFSEIVTYNALDVQKTLTAWRLLTNTAPELA